MKKIAFIGNSEPPAKLLDLFKKMTPGCSGEWGELKGVDNYKDADYFGVIDYLPSGLGIDESKCVFLGAHPPGMQAYKDMSNYKGLKMYDCKNTFGFGEWWLKYDYDYISNLKPMEKANQLGCIMSNADSQPYHKARLNWLRFFVDNNLDTFNLYGRIIPFTDNMKKYYRGVCGSYDPRGAATSGGNDHMSGKEEVYETHKYMIEFDAPGEFYFSERVFDCLFLWAVPVYWGCRNLNNFLPEKSFISLDITGDGSDFISLKDNYEERLPAITQARELLLNEYQLWPRIHQAIFGKCK